MRYARFLSAGIGIAVALAAVLVFSGAFTSQAVQAPKISLDMDQSGNTYSDPGGGGNNSMSVGTIDNCSTTAAPGNNNTHIHPVDVVIHDVEDLIGWQIRMNYEGGQMRPSTVNFAPFTDTTDPLNPQGVSFVNLPIDSGTNLHRGVLPASSIPGSAPGPQTAAAGSAYLGPQNAPISPDTPAKAVPDDTSYSAPTGGVLATLVLQVLAGNAGQPSLFMNVDDNTPNAPGSGVAIFDGTGSQDILLPVTSLGDGYHGEGATCVPLDCVVPECPPGAASPTPTATPPPSAAGHDAAVLPLRGVPPQLHLSPGEVVTDTQKIVILNNSNHADTIGVYVDITSPSTGGCAPNGRLAQTTVTLAAGAKTNVFIPMNYTCADPGAANGMSYFWVAVSDHAADDLAVCGPGMLQTAACINALNNDDESGFASHVKTHTGPQVVAQ